jgi:hypothetical protein
VIKKIFKSLLFIGIGLLALYLVFYFQQKNYNRECFSKGIAMENCSLFDKLITDFSNANIYYLLLTSLAFMISNLARALRWNMMLDPLGVKPSMNNSLGAIMIAYLTNLTIPRSGEFTRATVISKYENITFDKAFGTIIADRILDVISLLIMIGLTFLFAFDKIYIYFLDNLKAPNITSNLTLFTFLLLMLGFLLYAGKNKILESKFGQKAISFIKGLKHGILSVFEMQNPILFIFYSIVIWLMYLLMAYTMFQAFQPTEHLGLEAALVVFLFGSLGIIFPSPGGMGSYHFLTVQSLSLYGIDGINAFSYANMTFFTVQIFTVIITGVAFLLLVSPQKLKSKA